MNSASNNSVPSKKKPSELAKIKLFYEALDARDYLSEAEETTAKSNYSDRRIGRRRK